MGVPDVPEPVASRVGELIGGRYRLTALLDAGGQGQVYRARDERDHDDVALKLVADTATDGVTRERVFREAQALTRLAGTAAVRILDLQWTHDSLLSIVMELLHGRTFEDHLLAREAEGRRLDASELVPIIEPLVATLEIAHGEHILHRDIKPSNVFVLDPAHGGGVRLLDFGFVKFTRLKRLTADGFVAGSPSYLAPEAWRGERELDERADIYGLGAVIFRALAGAPPFTGVLGDIYRAATSAPRPSLHALRPDLPKEIDDWVAQALAIQRELRFTRMRGMWAAFRSICG
ncbi:MAG: serine/threonine-protein kinase [Sorangiineae bacterium]|nr:serine/threonine-protein kinase [Polyangiaceae bacterium]MEB2321878.1 serine/threonine-protein kinase [Sorangiineae bacterium]